MTKALERFARDIFPDNQYVNVKLVFDELRSLYDEGARPYHNFGHVEDCLHVFDYIDHRTLRRREVLAAIYYHDAFYDSKRKDNEERSAHLAKQRLMSCGYKSSFGEDVFQIIMGTKHAGGLTDPAAQLMADIDLAGFAVDSKSFHDNTRKIREEYAWVPDEDFRKGRKEFFRSMLARPAIYYLEPFKYLFESRARENLEEGVVMLSV